MGNLFSLEGLRATSLQNGKDKAAAIAGQYGLNELVGGHVLPPLPPYPKDGKVTISAPTGYTVEQAPTELTTKAYGIFGVPMCFPLWLKPKSWDDNQKYLLPMEPLITLGGGNTMAKRNVAKQNLTNRNRRGSIKEKWAVDDYSINITGILTKLDDWTYPKEDVIKLRQICEAREPIEVECDLLLYFGITKIVIEKFDFPFTKGEENQAYTISALSDDEWDLLIKIK